MSGAALPGEVAGEEPKNWVADHQNIVYGAAGIALLCLVFVICLYRRKKAGGWAGIRLVKFPGSDKGKVYTHKQFNRTVTWKGARVKEDPSAQHPGHKGQPKPLKEDDDIVKAEAGGESVDLVTTEAEKAHNDLNALFAKYPAGTEYTLTVERPLREGGLDRFVYKFNSAQLSEKPASLKEESKLTSQRGSARVGSPGSPTRSYGAMV